MPELPEVQTIVDDLSRYLPGLNVRSFKELNPLASGNGRMCEPSSIDFSKKIKGQKIISVSRRAKTLVFELENNYLLVHLKMTGQLVYRSCAEKDCEVVAGGHPIVGVGQELPNKFTRGHFILSDGSDLFFNDVRRFGWLKLVSKEEYQKYEQELGIEPFSEEFTLAYFTRMLERKKSATIKQAILEQKYLVGVGNIYADEALFEAKIKPHRQAGSLSAEEIKALWRIIPKLLAKAIKFRGTSFNDYRDAHGRKGNFVSQLKVY
ncbi:DNA-formamidopyrimidine glycosylase, partial [Candidatus Falkowbacteria bacterium]|nr:DNA-formamidopyrimidine glycosylase [Candidatus Falkowbacteria bacterium]